MGNVVLIVIVVSNIITAICILIMARAQRITQNSLDRMLNRHERPADAPVPPILNQPYYYDTPRSHKRGM